GRLDPRRAQLFTGQKAVRDAGSCGYDEAVSISGFEKSRHEGARPEPCTIEGEALKNPQVYTSNFLIEVYFKTASGHTGGVLMEKMKGNGYSLKVSPAGRLSFAVKGPGASAD